MKPDSSQLPIRVVLADDHDLVRSGIKALLSMIDGVEVIAEARDGHELVQLVDSLEPDIVMTDISMPRTLALQPPARFLQQNPSRRA